MKDAKEWWTAYYILRALKRSGNRLNACLVGAQLVGDCEPKLILDLRYIIQVKNENHADLGIDSKERLAVIQRLMWNMNFETEYNSIKESLKKKPDGENELKVITKLEKSELEYNEKSLEYKR